MPGPEVHVGDLIDALAGGPRTVLALSPHLDDAAFSAGATIAELTEAGITVHVHTLFAGLPRGPLSSVARTVHAVAGLPASDDAVRTRRSEDAAALAILDATWSHGDHPDAVYRRDERGDWLCAELWSVFNLDPRADEPLVEGVTAEVGQLLVERNPGLVLTCAAVGRHVDHAITTAATVKASKPQGVPLLLWEDLPYGMWVDHAAGRALAVACSPRAWDRKIEALASYRSQVISFWPAGADWAPLFRSHGARRGTTAPAERFWWAGDQPG